jgi:hypothetical protein
MKKLITICFLTAIATAMHSQTPVSKYHSTAEYSNGLALVSKNGLYGFIDRTGKEIIPLIYRMANSFSEGLATVCSNEKNLWGVINRSGDLVIDFKFISVGQPYELPYNNFEGGYLAVQIIGEEQYSRKYGLIDKEGIMVIPFNKEYVYIYQFKDGMAKIENHSNKFGFVNKAGELTVPMVYEKYFISDFSEGLASFKAVVVNKKGNSEFKTGFIDKNGIVTIPPEYDWLSQFSEGLAIVSKNGKVYFIDKNGQPALTTTHKLAFTIGFTNELCAVKKGKTDKEKYGFINKNGELAIPYEYDAVTEFNNGVSSVKKNGLFGIINTSNQVIYPFELYFLGQFHDGMAKYRYRSTDKNFGFMNQNGEKVTTCMYDGIYNFDNGKVRVKRKDGKWITIGKNGLQI